MRKKLSGIWILLLFSVALLGQTKEDLQQEKQKAYDEIKMARDLMEKTAAERSNSVNQVRLLQKGINARARLISTLQEELDLTDKDISGTEARIRQLSRESDRNKEEYARLIYYAFRNHSEYEKLMYILAGASISQSYQRYKYLKYISEYRRQKSEEIEAIIAELDIQKKQLNRYRNEKLETLEEKASEQEKLVGQRSRENEMINELKLKETQLREEISEKERIARELENKIREIIEEEASRLNASNTFEALTPEQELVGKDFKMNRGKLPWPVEKGIITVGFGQNEIPGLRGSSVQNNGIDISSSPGTEVRSVFAGEVTKVFAILGANYTVLIRHGEFLSVYQNLVNVRVKTGDKVLLKEPLGEAFTDETEQVATMHFEVWQERTILNPEEWISN
jgi:septal ring factor EnvC (AmiA/AmiB activator)